MRFWPLCLLLSIGYLVGVTRTVDAADDAQKKAEASGRPASTPTVTIREIDGPIDHNHCTTRQFQHMSFHHEGVWFVFYSDGKNFRYQTSDDSGKTWTRAEKPVAPAPNGSTSFDVFKVGNTVYVSHALYPLGRYDVNAPYAKDPKRRGEYTHEGRIKMGRIEGRRIRWSQDVNPGFTPDYCNLVRDSNGFFWVFTREDQLGTAHRSSKPNDIQSWEPKTTCLPVKGRHALDATALDDGKLYSVSLLTTDGKLYGNLYDGTKWSDSPVLIADDLTTVAGDDRRLAVEFDPTQKRLHLIYVDAGNRLRYRHLDSPYRQSDWQPALSELGTELASGVFTAALSVDSSSNPYGLVITYGKQKHLGKDKRRRTGKLYARRFDGQKWKSAPILISQTGTIHNWYPSVNQDAKDGLCVLYSRSIDKDNVAVPLAAMASLVKDLPDKVSASRTPTSQVKDFNAYPENVASYLKRIYGQHQQSLAYREDYAGGFRKWQQDAREALRHKIGLPKIAASVEDHQPIVELDDPEDLGEYLRQKGVIETEPDVKIPFWLLTPKGDGPWPLGVFPHGHDRVGHNTTAGVYSDDAHKQKSLAEDRDVAVQAVKLGFVSIAPAVRGLSTDGVPDLHDRHGKRDCRSQAMHCLLAGRTATGERVWDMQKILDWATKLDDVDSRHVLIMGNSGGGMVTLFTAACDERVGIAVPSCSFAPTTSESGYIFHCDCNMVPGLVELGGLTGVAGLIAPRHLLAVNGRTDSLFSEAAIERAASETKTIFKAVGHPKRFEHRWGAAGHRFYADLMWPFVVDALKSSRH